MVAKILGAGLLLIASHGFAQQDRDFTSGRPLKFNLALNQGFMLQHRNTDLYVSGNMEYFPEKNISIRGDCFWYIDSRSKDPVLKTNANILFGALVHLPMGRSDLYAGLQPGLSYIRPNSPDRGEIELPGRLMPLLSISAGYTLFFSKYCNFFIAANYMISKYRGSNTGSIQLDEIMISGGLGFHINTQKQKKGK